MTKTELTIAFALAGAMVSIISFFIVRWMNRVDTSLQKWSDREIQDASYTARIEGQIENLQKSIAHSNENIGALAGSVQRIRDIMIAQNMANERPSDKIIGQSGPR